MPSSLEYRRTDRWRLPLLLLALVPLFPEYISFFLVLAACGAAVPALRDDRCQLKVGLLGELLLAYIAYMAITVFYTVSRSSTLCTAGMWAFFFLVFLLLKNLLVTHHRVDTFLRYITYVAATVGLISCILYLVGVLTDTNPLYFWKPLDDAVFRVLPIHITDPYYHLRIGSTFTNPNILSEYMTATLPFSLCYCGTRKKAKERTAAYIAVALMLAGIVLTFSRGGYIALAFLLAALIVLNIRRHFAGVVASVMAVILFIPQKVGDRILSILPGLHTGSSLLDFFTSGADPSYNQAQEILRQSTADLSINARWNIWLESARQFLQYPLFGSGAGVETTRLLLKAHQINAIHAHNTILQILVEGGVFALILIGLVGLKTAHSSITLLRRGRNTRAFYHGLAALGFIAAFCIEGLADYPLLTPKLVCNFMLLLALIEQMSHLPAKKNTES